VNKDKVLDVWPDKGYFEQYYHLVEGGEACPRFHLLTAASALGACVARRVWFQRGSAEYFPTLYPNPWVVLVAPQGAGHKSSVINVASNLLVALPTHIRPRVLAAKITPEALTKTLAIQEAPAPLESHYLRPSATGLLLSPELGVLLGREKYNIGLIALLTVLYDCPNEWSSETIMRGDQRLYNVCLSLLGASTPDWMQSMLPQDAFKGGFMSRLLLVTLPPEWDKREPDPPPAPEGAFQNVLDELAQIHKVRGQMKWTPEAQAEFSKWYLSLEARPLVPGPVASYLERKQDHLLKLAMLLQLSYTYDELRLEASSLEQALTILNIVEEETSAIIEYVATEPRMRGTQFILELLRRHKRLTEADLLRLCWRSLSLPREFDDVMLLLQRAKIIKYIGGIYEYTGT